MSFLPISVNIKNKKLLIVGGGNVALQKLQNLLPFTHNITILAPDILPEIRKISGEKDIRIIEDNYNIQYLHGVFLVYACTDSEKLNSKILADAESMNVLCNRTDKAEESHFRSPGIVETKNMYVAINSKQKEVRKMVALRDELQTYLEERDKLIEQKEKQETGKVYLVGFGPGNPDLLTRKGEKVLFRADVICYDNLLDADFLNKYQGKKVYVGKRRGNHSKEQNDINSILYGWAKEGNMVVRLKGGDPLIYGRGSEERFYLEERNISVEIIPGISSAVAAAAYGDIPLTHRGISSSVAFGTAHGKNSFRILESDTSVYFMGAKHIKTIARKYIDEGYPEDYPVGIVYNVSLSDEQVIKTTISEIAKEKITVPSPVISIFGPTVNYKSILRKFQAEQSAQKLRDSR